MFFDFELCPKSKNFSFISHERSEYEKFSSVNLVVNSKRVTNDGQRITTNENRLNEEQLGKPV
jgi:hypothetical protein